MSVNEVISKIKDGQLIGKEIRGKRDVLGQWYVKA